MNHKHAFTLIELLVVVLIIGILASVAIPQYQVAVGKSKFIKLITIGDALHKAEELYYLENGTYTSDISQLTLDTPTTGFSLNLSSKEKDPFISIYASGLVPHYVYYLDHHPGQSYRGTRECRVPINATNSNKSICSSLTGTAARQTPNYWYWKF